MQKKAIEDYASLWTDRANGYALLGHGEMSVTDPGVVLLHLATNAVLAIEDDDIAAEVKWRMWEAGYPCLTAMASGLVLRGEREEAHYRVMVGIREQHTDVIENITYPYMDRWLEYAARVQGDLLTIARQYLERNEVREEFVEEVEREVALEIARLRSYMGRFPDSHSELEDILNRKVRRIRANAARLATPSEGSSSYRRLLKRCRSSAQRLAELLPLYAERGQVSPEYATARSQELAATLKDLPAR